MPGLKVVVPATAHDAKGLLVAAVEDDAPSSTSSTGGCTSPRAPCPRATTRVPIGSAVVAREGRDVTVAAVGPLVSEALKAADALDEAGIAAEVVDLRTLRPLERRRRALASVARTGRLVVADPDWGPCGITAEVLAVVAEHGARSPQGGARARDVARQPGAEHGHRARVLSRRAADPRRGRENVRRSGGRSGSW